MMRQNEINVGSDEFVFDSALREHLKSCPWSARSSSSLQLS